MGSITNILAGSDTTAVSLSAILHYLCTHPEKMQKLRDEIDRMDKKGQVSDPVTLRDIGYAISAGGYQGCEMFL